MKLIDNLIAWWNKPPVEERILDAMSFTEWRRGLKIIDELDISVGRFYVVSERLVEEGVVEKRFDGTRIFFRKLKSGHRRRSNVSRSIEIGAEATA